MKQSPEVAPQHTPTPWRIIGEKSETVIRGPKGRDGYGELVAVLGELHPEQDAALIVRAVNSHAALVAALRDCHRTLAAVLASHEAEPFRSHLDPAQRFQNDIRNAEALSRAALALAERSAS